MRRDCACMKANRTLFPPVRFPSLFRCGSVFLALFAGLCAAHSCAAWQADNGDGTYTNPPLYADYPDPDIIRVGEDFYFASSTFANSPGLNLLHSKDLVNWDLVGHVMPKLGGNPRYDLQDGGDYLHGIYAPSLRWRDGVFYLAVTPVGKNTRIYFATDIRGPWRMHELDREAFDPGLFFARDGTPYLATSSCADGHVTLLKLSQDLSNVVEASPLFYYPGIEGSKVILKDGWYYVFNSMPVKGLGYTVSRARELSGPWETREMLGDAKGGHQGAIVDLADGSYYGFIMKDCGAIGRMTYICPIFWRDEWPVWGTPEDPDRVPASAPKPILGKVPTQPATSDEFCAPALGIQWQWNHNPDDALWSLSERPGWLRLHATKADDIWGARNTLTQKGQGPKSSGIVRMDLSGMKPGAVCGLTSFGKYCGGIFASRGADGRIVLSMKLRNDRVGTEIRAENVPFASDELYLRLDMDFVRNVATSFYSADGETWVNLGGEFPLAFDWRTGTFQGQQYAIFCFGPQPEDSYADVDYFHFSDK